MKRPTSVPTVMPGQLELPFRDDDDDNDYSPADRYDRDLSAAGSAS